MAEFTAIHTGDGNYAVCRRDVTNDPEGLARCLLRGFQGAPFRALLCVDPPCGRFVILRVLNASADDIPHPGEALRALGAYLSVVLSMPDGIIGVKTQYARFTLAIRRSARAGMANVSLLYPAPTLDPAETGVTRRSPLLGQTVTLRGFPFPFYALSVGGIPYAVCPAPGAPPEKLRLPEFGTSLSVHPLFLIPPTTVFSAQTMPGVLSVRVWSPDNGELSLDGGGAAAALAVSVLRGTSPAGRDVCVRMRGGSLTASSNGALGTLRSRADAGYIFDAAVRYDRLTLEPY